MNAITFDTLVYAKTLREAGFTEIQAEAMTAAQNKAFAQMLENSDLATKGDIARLGKILASMETRMAETDARIAEMETRLLKAFSNYLFGFAGVIIAALAVAVAILK